MKTITLSAKNDLVEQILKLARQRVSSGELEQTELFLRQYYRRVPMEDLAGRGAEDLYFAALSMFNFIRQRALHEDKIRVYNPTVDEDGWSTSHTVIDLITGDRPFLVDSLTAELSQRDVGLALVVHPTIAVFRTEAGEFVQLYAPGQAPDKAWSEAVVRIEISHHGDPDALAELESCLRGVIINVRQVVDDWQPMATALDQVVDELKRTAPKAAEGEIDEAVAFLDWLLENNFTFLGYRCYDLVEKRGRGQWKPVPESALGILRDAQYRSEAGTVDEDHKVPPEQLEHLKQPSLLMITKTDRRATVHRPVHMDSIGIKRFSKHGKTIGAHRFVGLFTSTAYNRSPRDVPVLRQKVAVTVARAGFSPLGHAGKALTNILETYPRDELFQIGEDELLENSLGIMHLHERPRLRLFTRRDSFERFVSCLVYMPRDRFDSDLRETFVKILEDAFDGACSAFYTLVGDDPLARLHAIIRTTPGRIPEPDSAALEARLVTAARGWEETFRDCLLAAHDERQAAELERRYARAFTSGYRERFTARQAVLDIDRVEEAVARAGLALSLYRPPEMTGGGARFKIYNASAPVPLSDVLPMLENMGLKVLDEFPYPITPRDGAESAWIHDFGVIDRSGAEIDIAEVKEKFQEAFARVWSGETEDDGFNQLVTRAGLSWREVVILRAYCKYLLQAKIPFSQAYMERTLAANPALARLLVDLFRAQFDAAAFEPAKGGGKNAKTAKKTANKAADTAMDRAAAIQHDILDGLDGVANLDEDRILRRFLNVITATLRTNYFQTDDGGAHKDYVSFKIDSTAVDDLPLPRPMVEIFVYSPRMEGVHLRGGRVARGGLRWSDRPEDFRTEVLGLMKAQMVKNAVIVPVGSKGGFVVKRPPDGDREALMAEVIECYKTLIRGLLDITDNLVAGKVVPPKQVVRYDDDDPYLVVAADKGTASFSDIANGVSQDYGFWLGDAFASGGSVGYDHKKMGITARGAWESVKRHFRELGLDTQSETFTVIGIGDMSGDVFGNGMLLSEHIKLTGAFNHRHIFIDPDPDPAASFAERKRLFEMPRSGWSDYDPALISAGGGVFDRSAKSIDLSAETRAMLGVEHTRMTPNALISALLRARVDLLWNGGIGTYVKASRESHADVGDRANDSLRLDAHELRCRVIGEGGNLGFTQLARVEAAEAGVRLNNDAIDNSAGVDCSDHEVNIKILLDGVVAAGDMTTKQRNTLLARMTDEVGERCVADNYLQTLGISLIAEAGVARLDLQERLMQSMERDGRLNRAIEFLPDAEEIAERRAAKRGLSRPEISVLYAYAKNALHDELLASDLPDDPYLENDLLAYFPKPLRAKYPKQIAQHRLRREIIATQLANSIVNRASAVFPLMARDETGRSGSDIARAYVVTREAFGLRALWAEIEALDNQIPADLQLDMIIDLRRLMEHVVLWLLNNRPRPMDCADTIALFKPGVEALRGVLGEVLHETNLGALRAKSEQLQRAGVPGDLASQVGGAKPLASACDIVDVANTSQCPVAEVAATYYQLGARLGLDWLRDCAQDLKTGGSDWQRQAVTAIIDDLYGQQRALTARVVASAGGGAGAVEAWATDNPTIMARNERLFADLRSGDGLDLAMLAVANRQMRGLITG